ncbi:putative membrane protein YfcA [Mycoplana sp. BE70]|uniref:sulfite exporter TauE/SafE family protein n=1 Tax=Mycoplana sp. BE70 TaxID=2817775 RepID=UPI0028661159|nr:sulfite exporter TauE/SafE family protein [Mycoplana sp. BE70]MDR6759427.1 putative membrane protein YfcA [Mycoplana sp. BE70]
MNDLSIFMLLAVVATFFAAGTVKGVAGMGLPTVAMGILAGLLSPLAATSLLIIPSFVTNFWQLLAGPSFKGIVRRLWTMMAGVFAGTLASTSMLTGGDTSLSTLMLGLALTVYAVYTLLAKPYHINPRHECWLSPGIGLITGLISGATGVFVIPAVPYVQALGFEKDDLVQALGLSFTVSTVALAFGLASRGAFQIDGLSLSAFAVVPALVGMWAGQYIRRAVSPAVFKRCFLIALALLGAEMMLRSVW